MFQGPFLYRATVQDHCDGYDDDVYDDYDFGIRTKHRAAPKLREIARVLSSRSDSHDTAPARVVDMVLYGNLDRECC